ncbi:hypothetical protein [Micromonospora taraxaci]
MLRRLAGSTTSTPRDRRRRRLSEGDPWNGANSSSSACSVRSRRCWRRAARPALRRRRPLGCPPTAVNLTQAGDRYLDMSRWTKGVVWVHGRNLGRYWKVGPRQRLYLPAAVAAGRCQRDSGLRPAPDARAADPLRGHPERPVGRGGRAAGRHRQGLPALATHPGVTPLGHVRYGRCIADAKMAAWAGGATGVRREPARAVAPAPGDGRRRGSTRHRVHRPRVGRQHGDHPS